MIIVIQIIVSVFFPLYSRQCLQTIGAEKTSFLHSKFYDSSFPKGCLCYSYNSYSQMTIFIREYNPKYLYIFICFKHKYGVPKHVILPDWAMQNNVTVLFSAFTLTCSHLSSTS